ncbi:hypothetical protein RV01_GL000555 [Enterococcus dispar]|nr:hypothetical protein RV01_GL000555 [Enterococcus dispar]
MPHQFHIFSSFIKIKTGSACERVKLPELFSKEKWHLKNNLK